MKNTGKFDILGERACLQSSTNYLLFEDTMIEDTYGEEFESVHYEVIDELGESKGYFSNLEFDLRELVRVNRETYTSEKSIENMRTSINSTLEFRSADTDILSIIRGMKEYTVVTIKPLRRQTLTQPQQYVIIYT